MSFLTRFAPSPTGRLHLGHAYSALTAYKAAQDVGGRFILRIEDIDRTRCRPEYEAGILEDLAWLGIEWETPVRRQSDHFEAYASALARLYDLGVLYRCFRTRRELAEQSASAPQEQDAPQEDAAARSGNFPMSWGDEDKKDDIESLEARGPFAWRLSINNSQRLLGEEFARLEFISEDVGPKPERRTNQVRPDLLSDVILGRKDTPASYHLAVVHDDALQAVSHVIRGEDLLSATHIHVLLQRLLGLPTPVYRHHRLLTDEDGKRYAKRNRSLTLAALRADGVTPTDIRRRIGMDE
jgi:glutamyl-Q tRNA(Asp) synthetase